MMAKITRELDEEVQRVSRGRMIREPYNCYSYVNSYGIEFNIWVHRGFGSYEWEVKTAYEHIGHNGFNYVTGGMTFTSLEEAIRYMENITPDVLERIANPDRKKRPLFKRRRA